MIEDLQDVPPALPLLFTEVLRRGKDWADGRRRLKDLLPELRSQSEVYEADSLIRPRPSADRTSMEIHLDGGLNLLNSGGHGGCRGFSCRIAAAERLARSIGLIADTIWITDYLTEKFCRFGRVTNQKLDEILEDLLVLDVLWPLIVTGIVKFRSPWIPICPGCLEQFNGRVDEISEELAGAFSDQFSLDPLIGIEGYAMNTGVLFEPSITIRVMPGKRRLGWPPTESAYAREVVREAVSSALWVGREAALGSGAVFSNSKIGLAGLALSEGRVRNRSELQMLDERRTINLPWVSDLSPLQIVQLRQEASKALPMFRETLASRLAASDDAPSVLSGKEIIDELRVQAVDVRNELETTQQHAKRLWDTPYTMLALGISAYGFASDQPATAALGGLMGLLQLVMAHKAGSENEMDRLKRRPGYVLVKAQDILAHADIP